MTHKKYWTMSNYFTVKGLKVRISDHEPNYSMDRIRGKSDVVLYTKSADNRKLSIEHQIDRFLETPLAHNKGIVKSDFNKVLGKSETKTQILKNEYKTIDEWFNKASDNKELIRDLKKNPNWFVPARLNKQQKESWIKYLEKKLRDHRI